eukprot:gene17184-19592_t
MDSVKSVFRVILELSNDRASSTVYFMLLASCMTARTRYLRMKSNSTEVVDALTEKEPTVVRLDSIAGTSVKVYYLDGYHVSVDVSNETTLKEICERLLHDTRMGLYEVENEFGPSHEQRLLDAELTVGQLATRWKSHKWPHAKLIAPFYLKGWANSSQHENRHVHFENRQNALGSSPTAMQSRPHSPSRLTGTPEKLFGHSPVQSTGPATPNSTSPHRQARFRSQSPGTTARSRTTALIDALFNTGEEHRPRVEFINLPPSSQVEMPKPVYGTPPRTGTRSVTMADTSPAVKEGENTPVSSSARKSSPHSSLTKRSPVQEARSPAQSSVTPSPNNSGSKGNRKHRGGRATNLQAIPLRSSSSYATTLNTVSNARGAYSPVTTVPPSGPGSVSSTSTASSSNGPGSAPSNRSLESPPPSATASASASAVTSSTTSPLEESVPTPASPKREILDSCGVALYASPVRDAATSPITVLNSVKSPQASTSTPPVHAQQEAKLTQHGSKESSPNANATSNEKIRPRTTYVPIAGSAAASPAEAVLVRGFHQDAAGSQTSNVFDLNNSPALLPVPTSPKSLAKSLNVSSNNTREDDSPTTTGSGYSGASTPASVNGLSPYPSWRATPSPGTQAFGPDPTASTPPESINSVLFSRLFGRPELNEFFSPRLVVENNTKHQSPAQREVAQARNRDSRSSSPAGSVGSASDNNSVSSGRTRSRSSSRSSSRPPFDTTYSTPPLSQLIAAQTAEDHEDINAGMVNLMEDMTGTLDDGDCVTPLPSEHLPRRFLTPSGTTRRKQEASSVGTGIRHSASRLDRKTSSGTLSESDSSVASHQQTRLPRRSAHNTPASTNPKKNKANTPASTGTAGKGKRASVAAFGHGLRSPTSASIRELFEAQKKSHKAANAMPTPEQIAAGFYTQSYAQVHGGYMPPKHVFRPKHGTSDNEQSNLDSDSGSLRAHRPSRAHTSEGDEAALRHRNRGRSTSPHSVISNASSKGSRASSVNRKRMAHNWVP